jgi:Fic family protein
MAITWARKRRRAREKPSRRRVRAFVRSSLARSTPVGESFVLGLHSTILDGQEGKHVANYRNGPVRVRWKGRIVYVAPKAERVPSLMKALFDSAWEDGGRAGRVFLGLLKIHPFREANGRTARALATYILLLEGYREKSFRTLEKYIDSHLDGYYDALEKSSVEAPGPWDTYFSEAVRNVFSAPGSARETDLLALMGDRVRDAFRRGRAIFDPKANLTRPQR